MRFGLGLGESGIDVQALMPLEFADTYVEDQEYTLRELGDIMGITIERVRQIENVALRKLRHPSRVKLLEEFHQKT